MSIFELSGKAFQQTVLHKCYGALEAAGFTRFRKEGADWPLNDGFHCWVGLNGNPGKEHFEVNPFVGIHVVAIEKLWTATKTGKYPARYSRSTATYAVHMGTLMPHEPVFDFTQRTDVDAEAKRLANLYATIGLSYVQSVASYERLLPLLQERVPMLGAYPERVAACLYLMDRKEEARIFVEDFLKDHRDYFEGFAEPFLKLLTR